MNKTNQNSLWKNETERRAAAYQMQKEGIPSKIAAKMTGLKEKDLVKPEVRTEA
jgi:hypothetical protein